MRPPNKSRSRNKNRRNNNNNGGNVLNRVHDSAGPEGRVRGTPVQVIEKYQALAHDHSLAGDRVATENFQQHAEHYIRLINEAQRLVNERREQAENQQNKANGQDQNHNGHNNNNKNSDRNNAVDTKDPSQSEQPDIPPVRAENDQPKSETPVFESVNTADNDAGGLVETPENAPAKVAEKPKRTRAPRKPKKVEEPAPPSEA